MTLVMERFRKTLLLIIICFLIVFCFLINSEKTFADSKINENYNKKEIRRSLESLKDLDYQTWKIIVYPSSKGSENLILRIVGYPGSLRIDYPTDLVVKSGIKKWDLKNITKENKSQVESLNDSVAEFDLLPLISELDKNRPLRLSLSGLINDLSIPPYLVAEWRSLAEKND